MREKLKILAIAYVFPPDAGSGTFRTLHFANNWAAAGSDVTLVTVRESDFHATALSDPALLRQIHPRIKVVRATARRPLDRLIAFRNRFRRTRNTPSSDPSTPRDPNAERNRSVGASINDLLSHLLTFPDVHSGWIFDVVRQGRRIKRHDGVDCIYATGGPWSGIVAATLLHKFTKKPLVLDFRDPWASNPNFLRANKWLQRAHTRCERWCVRSASRVIANTSALLEDFVARYPEIPAERFACITNGFEELPPWTATQPARFTLTHAGELYLTRNPGNFLQALANLIERGELSSNDILIRFVGGIPREDPHIDRLAKALGTAIEIHPRLPHAEALQLQQCSSGLLLFQAGLPLQVPRKLYEYLAMRLPILAITERNSATAKILDDVDMQYTTPDSVTDIEATLLRLYRAWQNATIRKANEERLAAYSNQSLAAKLYEHMLSVVHPAA